MKKTKIIGLTILGIIAVIVLFIISTNAFDKFLCDKKENSKIEETTNKEAPNTEINNDMNFTEENSQNTPSKKISGKKIKLPEPEYSSNTSIEEALLKRKSIRDFQKKPLSLKNISQILWAAQGITDKGKNKRTAPSAGALYPLEIYLVVGNVNEIESGIYKYNPYQNELTLISEGDKRNEISKYTAQPEAIQTAPITVIFSAVYKRTSVKYGDRAFRYVHIEIGHAAQNVCLQVISLGLSTVTIGAFQDAQIKKTIQLLEEEEPLYIMPIGYAK